MRELSTYDKARVLIRAATGEEYGDGYIVTDVIVGYAEPGYDIDPDVVVVLGDWNNKRSAYDIELLDDPRPLTKADTLPSRLADALEKVGAQCEWLDEWARCENCSRAVRTQPDSYAWKPSYALLNDCEIVCAQCLREHAAAYVDDEDLDYVNNPHNAITWLGDAELEQLGWTQWEPANPHTYENGWHPGQTDDPVKVLEEIRRETSADVVFRIHEQSQFYLTFRAYTRDADMLDEERTTMSEREITRATPADAGCWVEGWWGQYAAARVCQIAFEHGWTDDSATAGPFPTQYRPTLELVTQKLANLAMRGPDLTMDEDEQITWAADDAELWMNEHVAPAGYAFGWSDGEWFLWSDADWEGGE